MYNSSKFLFLFTLCIFIFCACGEDDETPEPPMVELNATTLEFTLMTIGGDTIRLRYQDLDGPGGDTPIVEGGTLVANGIYFGEIKISDESISPSDDLTIDIEDDRSNFQFFFISDGLNITTNYADVDDENNPVGLFTAINTGDASSGNLIVNLQSGPNKSSQGVAQGQIDNAGGRTVIQANFPITIQ